MAGAEVMVLPSIYPAAPATIQPTASPTMILAFFRNGEPNNSVIMMVMNERKPRPMNSGEPHLRNEVNNPGATQGIILRKRMFGRCGRTESERTARGTCLTTVGSSAPVEYA